MYAGGGSVARSRRRALAGAWAGDFPPQTPGKKTGANLAWQAWKRPRYLKAGAAALEDALQAELGETTLGEIWRDRNIALAIPAVETSRYHAWVFKTPHLANTRHRDDGYRLVDVCLATTAAPVYRSMTRIENPDTPGHHVFVDGGLTEPANSIEGMLIKARVAMRLASFYPDDRPATPEEVYAWGAEDIDLNENVSVASLWADLERLMAKT